MDVWLAAGADEGDAEARLAIEVFVYRVVKQVGAYAAAMERVVVPALEAYRPDWIAVASGLDANALDPLSHALCYSETFREMTRQVKSVAEDVCAGRLVVCQEGGYSPVYIPYCGVPIVEELSGHRTEVEDPLRAWVEGMGGDELLPHQEAAITAAAKLVEGCSHARPRGV